MPSQVESTTIRVVDTDQPFSSFKFTEDNFAGTAPIRRLFSIGRGHRASTLVIEDIPAAGAVEDENNDLGALAPDYLMGGLKRVSFWTNRFNHPEAIKKLTSRQCLGYAILKRDVIPSRNVDAWHVFEAVFEGHPQRT